MFQPLLFASVGACVELERVTGALAARAALLVALGCAVRLATAFAVVDVGGGGAADKLSVWERAFCAVAWLPKASVQAALAPYPLYVARTARLGARYEAWGEQILVIGVLSILLTAPAGAMLIDALGPRWLRKAAAPEPDAV